ncbi:MULTISPECIES: hypothetical protein [unclassified Streptomyces]|uniref:hypothetical protein n=1 Tax=unclassified Streptomyces TaxID=2593676 RepID=UPI00278BFCBC|nr:MULTISPECIES: hypothetical protein [unclassified Streptomyces]
MPVAPPAFGPAQELGFGPPPRPARPPAGPADPVRAVAAGLLNLSGLGLGYVLVRRRLLALLCVAATAALLTVALPADPDGVPAWALVGYGVLLLAAAADGARRGLRTTTTAAHIRPVVAIGLAVALLAVPAAGAVGYDRLRDDAVEDMLLDRLDRADALVEKASGRDFAAARADYRDALRRYRALTEDHPDSKAAHRVHDSLDAYYKAVSAPYADGEHCAALAPLEHLRAVPHTIDRAVLGSLATWPDKPLAASLLKCGTGRLGTAESDGKGGELGQLLRTFPESAQADRVEPAVRAAVDRRAGELKGAAPCPATQALRRIGDTAKQLPAPVPEHVRGAVATAVADGAYACGIDQFKDKKFSAARKSLASFAGTYKHDKRRARAQQVAIAAEIAQLRPAAGDRLPPSGGAGGSGMEMVISNDGPDPVDVLYTGPVTGRITIAACGSCKTYPTEAAGRAKACKASGKSYPKKTLRLPAGTYHFLHKPGGSSATATGRAAGGRIQPGYTYTQCSYVVRSDLGAEL